MKGLFKTTDPVQTIRDGIKLIIINEIEAGGIKSFGGNQEVEGADLEFLEGIVKGDKDLNLEAIRQGIVELKIHLKDSVFLFGMVENVERLVERGDRDSLVLSSQYINRIKSVIHKNEEVRNDSIPVLRDLTAIQGCFERVNGKVGLIKAEYVKYIRNALEIFENGN